MKKQKIFFVLLRYIILFLLFAFAIFFLRLYFNSRKAVIYQKPLKIITTVKPKIMTLQNSLEISSYIESENTVILFPFVNGTILALNKTEGDKVKKDEVIAQIDDEAYRLQLIASDALYLEAASAFSKIKTLYETGSTTKQNYDSMEAKEKAAKAQMELAKLQYSHTQVKSPIDGNIISLPSKIGNLANTQTPIAIIQDPDNLVVNVAIPDKYYPAFSQNIASIKAYIKIKDRLENKMEKTECDIISISNYIDGKTKTFNLKLKIKENKSSFVPGMAVNANLIYREKKDVYVLSQKVKRVDNAVYILNKDSRAEKIELPTLFETDEYFEIPKEYKDNEFLLTGQHSVINGEKVNAKKGDAK